MNKRSIKAIAVIALTTAYIHHNIQPASSSSSSSSSTTTSVTREHSSKTRDQHYRNLTIMNHKKSTTLSRLSSSSISSSTKVMGATTTATIDTTDNDSTTEPSSSSSAAAAAAASPLLLKKNQPQRTKSVFYMTLAMAIHFAGHEITRSPTMSMFTSQEMGFQSSAILPLAVGFVSPFSVLLLLSFSKNLQKFGPRYALSKSTLWGSGFMLFIGISLFYIKHYPTTAVISKIITTSSSSSLSSSSSSSSSSWNHIISKCLLFMAFVFQSANVQFLYTQHWSFIGSVLTPTEIASFGSLIAGIGSITSTLAVSIIILLL